MNFSDKYNIYYSVYRYVIKEDSDVLYLISYLDLRDVLKIEKVIVVKKRKGKNFERGSVKKKNRKEKRLFIYDVV